MSLTPGWIESDNTLRGARSLGEHTHHYLPAIYQTHEWYYVDQFTEYKKFPRTKDGWWDLCEALKEFEP